MRRRSSHLAIMAIAGRTMARRPWPPYLRRSAPRTHDPAATVWVVCGTEAWAWAREREGTHHVIVVCPSGEDPHGFDWEACAGHDPVLLIRAGRVDGAQVRGLIAALLESGVERILDESGDRYMAEPVDG